jgi:hypothetical protein
MKTPLSADAGIVALGSDCFRALHYNKELLNDGLSRMMWTVTFILNNDVVVTESCVTLDIALSVALTAMRESRKI